VVQEKKSGEPAGVSAGRRKSGKLLSFRDIPRGGFTRELGFLDVPELLVGQKTYRLGVCAPRELWPKFIQKKTLSQSKAPSAQEVRHHTIGGIRAEHGVV